MCIYTVVHKKRDTFIFSIGSAATDLRWGEHFNKFLFRSSLLNIVVKKLRKSVNICQSYRKNKSVWFFYGPQCIYRYVIKERIVQKVSTNLTICKYRCIVAIKCSTHISHAQVHAYTKIKHAKMTQDQSLAVMVQYITAYQITRYHRQNTSYPYLYILSSDENDIPPW